MTAEQELIAKDLTDSYYRIIAGDCISEDTYKQTLKTFQYLSENFDYNFCFNLIKSFKVIDPLTPKDLPDSLWNDSLLKRDTYYYHHILHINSKSPIYNWETDELIEFPFYKEMKIMFTMNDVLNYYHSKQKSMTLFNDDAKELGYLKYLYDRYTAICIKFFSSYPNHCEPIDFLLLLIDNTFHEKEYLKDITELKEFEYSTLEMMNTKIAEATALGFNKIVWR